MAGLTGVFIAGIGGPSIPLGASLGLGTRVGTGGLEMGDGIKVGSGMSFNGNSAFLVIFGISPRYPIEKKWLENSLSSA